jgi:LysM repeat protein
MDRICPFLALAVDGRTVTDGVDPDHRCHALVPAGTLSREMQAQVCLTERHRTCERFLSGLRASEPISSDFVRTRHVVEPTAGWRAAARRGRTGTRRAAAPLALVAILALSVGTAAAIGGVRALNGSADGPSPSASPSLPVVVPSGSIPATPSPTVPATPSPTPTTAPTPTVAPTSPPPTPTPTPVVRQTYVVQAGDTLSLIANRFGTTVAALQRANNLASADVITVGQVLVIP